MRYYFNQSVTQHIYNSRFNEFARCDELEVRFRVNLCGNHRYCFFLI